MCNCQYFSVDFKALFCRQFKFSHMFHQQAAELVIERLIGDVFFPAFWGFFRKKYPFLPHEIGSLHWIAFQGSAVLTILPSKTTFLLVLPA